ncbi:Protein CBG26928 [Caenorhabditis briggsae]|uniref:Protein CBG26928 n=1 Tax=Caenorhabditis briggsae TaxID=6238 RepID=B6IH79_CAEBR|nr:Protein CBG26928 [Caenorhabditis briggsae]CAR99259.1 Protein CBG26928 [Caenorhabditis briggsae]
MPVVTRSISNALKREKSKFPLFKLPMLCVEEILYLIEILDLIRISYLSKRTHRIIKSLKSAITDLRVFELGEEFLLQFYIKEKFESVGNIRVNNGLELRNKKSLSPTVVLSWKKRVIDYMTQLFKIPVLILIIYSDKISDVCLENIIFDQECQDLTIHGKRPINNGTLEKVFELSKSKRIIMHVPIKPGFQLDTEKMKGRNISIKDGSWLNYKRDNKFMELCTNFELMDDHFVTPFRFASFVDKWIRSDDKHFENCLVTWTNITVDDVDFRNFPFIPFDRSQRSQTYKYNKKLAIDLAEGYDILRGDGTLATIGILEDGFFFGVWHNRFHEIDGQEIWISRKTGLF